MRPNDIDVRRRPRRLLATVTPIALAAGALAFTPMAVMAAAPAATPAAVSTAAVPANWHYACGDTFRPGQDNCFVIKDTTAHPSAQTVRPNAAFASVSGYGPTELQAAYGLTAASAADGSGTTVAVVDAFNDPTAASDLAEYRSAAGLPALTAGQFTVYNQDGETSPLPAEPPVNDDWTVEASLDVDMVSAICPLCKIDLVEANKSSGLGLYVAVRTAATVLGARYISNSWGGPESADQSAYNSEYFGVPGVVYTASAGDFGYDGGVNYPASSPDVVTVGGTTLRTAANARGWTESVWGTSSTEGTGSGCSAYQPQPSWQASISLITGACSHRVDNDVAADADPDTGAAIYDTSNGNQGWAEVGGTSESAPIIAAVFALAGNNGNGGNNAADSIYTHTSALNVVTVSGNGTCTPPSPDAVLCTATGAASTYNGPTGWGTPNGLGAFRSNSPNGDIVTVTSPGNQTSTFGKAVNLQISATDSAASQRLIYSAAGLPSGLIINSLTGVIAGTPDTPGNYSPTVTARDALGVAGSASFNWAVDPSPGGGCAARQLLRNGGFDIGSVSPWTASPNVLADTSGGHPAQSGSYLVWLDGYAAAHTDTLAQTVSIPSTCNNAVLTYWVQVNSDVTSPARQPANKLVLDILNSAGTVVQAVPVATAANRDFHYVEYSTNLSVYIGQTITVKFIGTEAGGGGVTSYYEDSNALNVS